MADEGKNPPSSAVTAESPMVRIRDLTVQEWELLRGVLHGAAMQQQLFLGDPSGLVRIDSLPEPFAALYKAVREASRA